MIDRDGLIDWMKGCKMKGMRLQLPLLVLILANLIPVVGVLRYGWSVFEIVSLYWFENVVIGAVNILKFVVCSGDLRDSGHVAREEGLPEYMRTPPAPAVIRHGAKIFMIPFFTFHYGMFCFVHGLFVFTLLGGRNGARVDGNPFSELGKMIGQIFETGGKWFVIAILFSHLFSFVWNFIGKGEFRKTSLGQVMAAPYGRIVVLHVAIVLGAFVTTALGSPVYLLLLLVIGKIILDAKLHLRSHRKYEDAVSSD